MWIQGFNRMVVLGVIEEPKEDYLVIWPDLNAPSSKDKADVGRIRTEAISKYVVSGADAIVPPKEFLSVILGMSDEEVEAIETSAQKWIGLDEEEDPEVIIEDDDE